MDEFERSLNFQPIQIIRIMKLNLSIRPDRFDKHDGLRRSIVGSLIVKYKPRAFGKFENP